MSYLEVLQGEAEVCNKCVLGCPREGKLVFGSHLEGAKWLFVGEAPGLEESLTGMPFVGRSGHLLNTILEELGWKREQVGVMNTVQCRPPKNRPPTDEEKKACRYYFEKKIKTIKPVVITTLGKHAASSLLGSLGAMGSVRGKVYEALGAQVVPTFHPSYALRCVLGARDTIRDDLILSMSILAEKGIGP